MTTTIAEDYKRLNKSYQLLYSKLLQIKARDMNMLGNIQKTIKKKKMKKFLRNIKAPRMDSSAVQARVSN